MTWRTLLGNAKSRYDKMVGLVEKMLKLHMDSPKAKTLLTANGLRLTAFGQPE